MDTFEMYKLAYIKAKTAYINTFDKLAAATQQAKEEGRDPDTDQICKKLRDLNWEAEIDAQNTADLMGGYLTQQTMANPANHGLNCLISVSAEMEPWESKCFKFQFNFMPVPAISSWEDKDPELEELANVIKYGIVNMEEAKRLLDKFQIKRGNETALEWISDNMLMDIPGERWINLLAKHANEAIKEFES